MCYDVISRNLKKLVKMSYFLYFQNRLRLNYSVNKPRMMFKRIKSVTAKYQQKNHQRLVFNSPYQLTQK